MMWNAQLEEMFRILYENGIDEMELWACLLYTSRCV